MDTNHGYSANVRLQRQPNCPRVDVYHMGVWIGYITQRGSIAPMGTMDTEAYNSRGKRVHDNRRMGRTDKYQYADEGAALDELLDDYFLWKKRQEENEDALYRAWANSLSKLSWTDYRDHMQQLGVAYMNQKEEQT